MSIQLIVNADDYGRTSLVSAGIRSAHLNGIVTSTTAMMNLPGIELDLEDALQECPNLGLGVHLDLTAGKPICPLYQVNSLVDKKGRFPSSEVFLNKLPAIDLEQVRIEWDAQIKKFIQLTGKAPDHLDSHHHTSYLSFGLFKMMLEIAKELQCAIRPPLEEGGKSLPMDLPPELRESAIDFIPKLLRVYSPVKPDMFYSSFYDQSATSEHLQDILGRLEEGVSEIMCHPGFLDKELQSNSSYATQREEERRILEEDRICSYIKKSDIQLINFGDLMKQIL